MAPARCASGPFLGSPASSWLLEPPAVAKEASWKRATPEGRARRCVEAASKLGLARLAAVAASLGLALAVTAAEARPRVSLLGHDFPETVAGFTLQDTTDYESKARGLGYSVYYRKGAQWADVYIYALGRDDIPARYDEATSQEQFVQASEDIQNAAKAGMYRKASLRGAFTVPESGTPRLDCARYDLVDREGEPHDSILCVTNQRGKFLKIRLSGPPGSLPPEAANRFLKPWLGDR